MRFNRRRIIAGSAAAAALGGTAAWWLLRSIEDAAPVPEPAAPAARVSQRPALAWRKWHVWRGRCVAAAHHHRQSYEPCSATGQTGPILTYEVEQGGNRFFNPLLKIRKGAGFRARFWNALDEESIIHWHGFEVDSNNDGHPHYAVPGGATYDYQFTVANRAATYWYHAHPHHLTGKQVYLGLAGPFIVEDDEELELQRTLDLASASQTSCSCSRTNVSTRTALCFTLPTRRPRARLSGTDTVVNLTPRPYSDATTRIYRFASSTRPTRGSIALRSATAGNSSISS
jgi:FtsP/CotA-like multicopper oxidase with cupredoxin domain